MASVLPSAVRGMDWNPDAREAEAKQHTSQWKPAFESHSVLRGGTSEATEEI